MRQPHLAPGLAARRPYNFCERTTRAPQRAQTRRYQGLEEIDDRLQARARELRQNECREASGPALLQPVGTDYGFKGRT
jgi:hypothetical protein